MADEKMKELLTDFKTNDVCLPYSEFGKSACPCCDRIVKLIEQALALLAEPAETCGGNVDKVIKQLRAFALQFVGETRQLLERAADLLFVNSIMAKNSFEKTLAEIDSSDCTGQKEGEFTKRIRGLATNIHASLTGAKKDRDAFCEILKNVPTMCDLIDRLADKQGIKLWGINIHYIDDMANKKTFSHTYQTNTIAEAIGRAYLDCCNEREDCYLICKILWGEIG